MIQSKLFLYNIFRSLPNTELIHWPPFYIVSGSGVVLGHPLEMEGRLLLVTRHENICRQAEHRLETEGGYNIKCPRKEAKLITGKVLDHHKSDDFCCHNSHVTHGTFKRRLSRRMHWRCTCCGWVALRMNVLYALKEHCACACEIVGLTNKLGQLNKLLSEEEAVCWTNHIIIIRDMWHVPEAG